MIIVETKLKAGISNEVSLSKLEFNGLGQLKRILTPEGYLSPNGTQLQYNYFVNDYLGNVRTVLTWNWFAQLTNNYRISQQTDYYAFGLPTYNSLNPEAQPYKREGKEYDEMHGLNMYDQGWRQFGAALPVTLTIDPMAEKYYNISPYAQWGNNPVRYVDPTGTVVVDPYGIYSNYYNYISNMLRGIYGKLGMSTLSDEDRSAYQSLANAYHRIIIELEMLDFSSQVYHILSPDSKGLSGVTEYNFTTGTVEVYTPHGNIANNAHEFAHAYQFETGQLSFSRDGDRGILYDMGDEINAYNRSHFVYERTFHSHTRESVIKIGKGEEDLIDYSPLPLGPIDIHSYEGQRLMRDAFYAGLNNMPLDEAFGLGLLIYSIGNRLRGN